MAIYGVNCKFPNKFIKGGFYRPVLCIYYRHSAGMSDEYRFSSFLPETTCFCNNECFIFTLDTINCHCKPNCHKQQEISFSKILIFWQEKNT